MPQQQQPGLSREERRILAVENARARRAASASRKSAQIEWFIREVSDVIEKTMRQRVQLATELVKSKVVFNISVPVKKVPSKTTGRIIVTERSKPGEFPRADTTQLMRTIFSEIIEPKNGVIDGFIGTPLSYGLKLEVEKKLNRSFLRRTFLEERVKVFKILTGPIKGVSNRSSTIGHN